MRPFNYTAGRGGPHRGPHRGGPHRGGPQRRGPHGTGKPANVIQSISCLSNSIPKVPD